MAEIKKLKSRNEMNEQDKWAIEDLYPTDDAWEADYKKLENNLKGFKHFQGKLLESPETLLECLQFADSISQLAEKIYVYSTQKSHEDLSNTTYQSAASRAQNLMVQLTSVSAFLEPELLSIPEDTLEQFLSSNDELSVYRKFFHNIVRKKEHVLNKDMEELLAQTAEISEAASDIFTLFNNADLKFPSITDENGEKTELTHGRYITFMESSNLEVRKQAFYAMYHTYLKYKNTLAATYAANVKKDAFYAKVRKYPSSLTSALDDSNIPVAVYDNLISTVHKHLPLLHRYVSLRKKALGLNELHMYDLYTPLVSDVQKDIPYDEAKQIVLEGLAPMGYEYLSLLEEGFVSRWIDVYENQGKKSGAYSWGAYGTHPYVMLNYQNNLNNVFTLAHEMGHALHSYYSDANQPYVYAGYKIFVAEVASTCNESLLIHHLMGKTTDRKEKAYLVNYFLEQFRGTLFRQTMFAEFEKITHEMVEAGEVLTEESLCQLYHDLNRKYYGNDIVVDDEIAIEWARIPHFYRAFYVYQYATGFSAAIALSKRIMELGSVGVSDYMKFLKGGSSAYPIELLQWAGVDMTTEQPIEQALLVFESLLNELEDLLK